MNLSQMLPQMILPRKTFLMTRPNAAEEAAVISLDT
jgi:hypothetical protein